MRPLDLNLPIFFVAARFYNLNMDKFTFKNIFVRYEENIYG